MYFFSSSSFFFFLLLNERNRNAIFQGFFIIINSFLYLEVRRYFVLRAPYISVTLQAQRADLRRLSPALPCRLNLGVAITSVAL